MQGLLPCQASLVCIDTCLRPGHAFVSESSAPALLFGISLPSLLRNQDDLHTSSSLKSLTSCCAHWDLVRWWCHSWVMLLSLSDWSCVADTSELLPKICHNSPDYSQLGYRLWPNEFMSPVWVQKAQGSLHPEWQLQRARLYLLHLCLNISHCLPVLCSLLFAEEYTQIPVFLTSMQKTLIAELLGILSGYSEHDHFHCTERHHFSRTTCFKQCVCFGFFAKQDA